MRLWIPVIKHKNMSDKLPGNSFYIDRLGFTVLQTINWDYLAYLVSSYCWISVDLFPQHELVFTIFVQMEIELFWLFFSFTKSILRRISIHVLLFLNSFVQCLLLNLKVVMILWGHRKTWYLFETIYFLKARLHLLFTHLFPAL